MTEKKGKFVIIDGNAIIHRTWHALPPTLTTKKGEVVNAVYGFTSILLKVLKDLRPTSLAVAFDLKGPTFRHEEYREYKATREKKPDELYEQIPKIKKILGAFHIPILEKEGFEADDIIATLTEKFKHSPLVQKIVIVTGDMDTFQLVDETTEVVAMHKGISDTLTYTPERIQERFGGLTPQQLVDFKALRGDPSDNIPGVRGIGEKTAIQLLKAFHTLEDIYKNIDSPKISPRYRELLKKYKQDAFLSKKLVQLKKNVPLKIDLKKCAVRPYDREAVIKLFQELEFRSLLSRLPEMPTERHNSTTGAKTQAALDFGENTAPARPRAVENGSAVYQLVDTDEKFSQFLKELKKQKTFAFDIETSGFDPLWSKVLGVGFSWREKSAFYVPAKPSWILKLKPVFENPHTQKIGQNMKFDIEGLLTLGINVSGKLFDTMIASYLLRPGTRQHSLSAQVFSEFGYQMQPIEDLIGKKGKKQLSLAEVDVKRVAEYCCEDADFTFRLVKPLMKRLKETNHLSLFEKIEMPLIPILVEMEKNGVKIDVLFFHNMSSSLGRKIALLEKKIYSLAKREFNIASPIQLKEVLFHVLKIPTEGIHRTKTGISSASDELEKLKDKHPIIPLIQRHRELTKLKSTYLDALPKLVRPETGRVHTSFNQTITATGRLSSSRPNLQNIPVRTDLGQKIRRGFVAEQGCLLLSADYSQIELRIAASLANEKTMLESFQKGEDIHAKTAAEINRVPLERVTPAMRRAAKAVNFGILYGMGAQGLSAREGISLAEARAFIEKYFSLYKNIQRWIEKTKDEAKKRGYVETLFGRRRYLPDIHSNIPQIRSAAERMAVNHPIQGTAADIIKLAMIEVHNTLPQFSKEAKIILQVHDELLFEVPKAQARKLAERIKNIMEKVSPTTLPVEVNIKIGKNWEEMEEV